MLGVSQYELSYPGDGASGEVRERRGRQSNVRSILWLAGSAIVVIGILNSREAINSAFDRKRQTHAPTEVETLVERLGEPKSSPTGPPGEGSAAQRCRRHRRWGKLRPPSGQRAEVLNQGKSAEAQAVLRALAEEEAAQGRAARSRAAEKFHRLGVIASLDSPEIAQEALAKAVQLQPSNAELLRDLSLGYAALAEHYTRSGERALAAMALREGKSVAERVVGLSRPTGRRGTIWRGFPGSWRTYTPMNGRAEAGQEVRRPSRYRLAYPDAP